MLDRLAASNGGRRFRDAMAAARALAAPLVELQTELILVKDLVPVTHAPGGADLRAELVTAPDARLFGKLPAAWHDQPAIMARFRRYIASRVGCILMYEGDAVFGCVWFTRRANALDHHPQLLRLGIDLRDDDVWMYDLCVLPTHRKRGSAGLLLAEDEARKHGFRRAMLAVRKQDQLAQRRCATLGWTETSVLRSLLLARRILMAPCGVFVRNRAGRRQADFNAGPAWLVSPRPQPLISSAATAGSRS